METCFLPWYRSDSILSISWTSAQERAFGQCAYHPIPLTGGTGLMLRYSDVADENPTAEVLGIDLSPTQPTYVPPNLSFQIDDCTANWTYPPNTFDLIHIRACDYLLSHRSVVVLIFA